MNILYGYSNCTYKKYNELFRNASVMVLQQAQKYHSLMIRGLKENGVEIQCISGLPVNREFDKSIFTEGGNETEDGIKYHYFSSVNLPGFRQIMIAIKALFYTLFKRNIDVAICDILNLSVLIGIFIACKIRRIPLVGIVTDVPGKLADKGVSVSKRIDAVFMQRMDGYVFLTQWMNPIVNPHNRPYVVIEGQVDSEMEATLNTLSLKETPRVMMYAGSIKEIYGIKSLTQAFFAADMPDWTFHIYGDGDYRDELVEIAKKHPQIQYKGIRLNKEIVEAELKASLLVNPRPTTEEYVKYSFPSKNMEYMASGTPVLTTYLPGMPDEYLEHVYLFDNETVDGMTHALRNVLSNDSETLKLKGSQAKKFVLKYKNQKCQANKVCNLLNILVQ